MGKNSGASGRPGYVSGRTVKIFGRYVANIATAASSSTQSGLVLHPGNLSNRFVEMMDMFEQWRWLKMHFTIFPNATGNTVAVGIVGTSNVTTQPTSFQAITQFDQFRILGNGQTVPVKFRVPPAILRGQTPWYDGSTNSYPAVAYFTTGTAATGAIVAVQSTVTYMLEAEIEFKGASDPNVTLARFKSRFFELPDDEEELSSDESVVTVSSKQRPKTRKPSRKPP